MTGDNENAPVTEQPAELVVTSVERSGLMSAQIVVAAARSFDFVVDRGDALTHPIMNGARQISIEGGATFHLTVPTRLAAVGRTISFAEVQANPAFFHLWTPTESTRKRRWWDWFLWT